MKGRNDMYESIVDLSPKLATEILRLSKQTEFVNRNINWTTVNTYAAEMSAGRWKYNAEAIYIGCDNALLDGQHRVHAVIRSGVTIRIKIIYNFPRDLLSTINIGISRTPANYLKMLGYDYAGPTARVVRGIISYQKYGVLGNYGPTKTTPGMVRDFVERNPEIVEISGRYAKRMYTDMWIHANVSGSLVWLVHPHMRQMAHDFFDRVATCTSLSHGMPELALRTYLQSLKISRRKKDNQRAAAVAVVVAWNDFAKQKPRSGIKVLDPMMEAEKFPSIYGIHEQPALDSMRIAL